MTNWPASTALRRRPASRAAGQFGRPAPPLSPRTRVGLGRRSREARISQMAPRRMARDLRMPPVNQGFPAKPCSSEGRTEWVTATSVTCVSISTVL